MRMMHIKSSTFGDGIRVENEDLDGNGVALLEFFAENEGRINHYSGGQEQGRIEMKPNGGFDFMDVSTGLATSKLTIEASTGDVGINQSNPSRKLPEWRRMQRGI